MFEIHGVGPSSPASASCRSPASTSNTRPISRLLHYPSKLLDTRDSLIALPSPDSSPPLLTCPVALGSRCSRPAQLRLTYLATVPECGISALGLVAVSYGPAWKEEHSDHSIYTRCLDVI
jgi:hypothetical protein